jgi:hypothetical protein
MKLNYAFIEAFVKGFALRPKARSARFSVIQPILGDFSASTGAKSAAERVNKLGRSNFPRHQMSDLRDDFPGEKPH